MKLGLRLGYSGANLEVPDEFVDQGALVGPRERIRRAARNLCSLRIMGNSAAP